ncbi:hypothetical protein [Streptomyces phaeoluteigriseus]
MSTPTERADEMARLVIAAAQQDNGCVVTSGLVDTVTKMHAGTEHGKANPASVRRLIRARTAAEGVRVVLTDDERYWAIREQLHHMGGDQVHALRDSIADGGDYDPRANDAVLIDAISVRLSNRFPPRRLDGVEPVSISLWHEPEPDGVGSLPEYAELPGVAEALEVLRSAGVRVATVPGRKMLYREWHSPEGPQGAFVRPHAGRTLEVAWFIDGAQEERGMRSRDTRTVRDARNQALDDIAAAFRGAGWTVWRVESSNTATRRGLRVDVTPPADDDKARRRAVGFAAKWWAEQHTEEPTDEALRATFAHCVKPPRPELYPVIRKAIAAEMPPAAAAPLFTALAAHEAVRDASLSQSPRDLHAVACHMETLPLAAPISLHPELREARDAAEEAWQALRTADSLTASNAAHDKARTAVERAGAVILAVAPHAHRMHGTDMPATADGIRAAALAYNAVDGAPEVLSAVETGTPTVRVHCRSDSGTGWTVTATITAGVDSSVGRIPAHPPIVVKFRKPDGRQDAAANARRVFGALFRVDVPVAYDLDRRP